MCILNAKHILFFPFSLKILSACYVALDIVEGMVNKGIFLNGDNGGTFLHFGNYQNTCISDPMLCGPEGESTIMQTFICKSAQSLFYFFISFYLSPGITFSFFWKNLEAASRFAVASGGKVISNGFSVFTNPLVGHVEIYTRGNNHRWKAKIPVPGIMNEFPCFRAQSHLSYINHWSSLRNAGFFFCKSLTSISNCFYGAAITDTRCCCSWVCESKTHFIKIFVATWNKMHHAWDAVPCEREGKLSTD